MSFAQFGIKSFVPETRVAAFAAHLAEGKVMATRCGHCGKLSFPPRSGCPSCGSDAWEWEPIEGVGRLLTHTTVMYGPAGFENEVPYTLAVVGFPTGIKVFGALAPEVAGDGPKVGMPLRVMPRQLSSGRVSYHFVKA